MGNAEREQEAVALGAGEEVSIDAGVVVRLGDID